MKKGNTKLAVNMVLVYFGILCLVFSCTETRDADIVAPKTIVADVELATCMNTVNSNVVSGVEAIYLGPQTGAVEIDIAKEQIGDHLRDYLLLQTGETSTATAEAGEPKYWADSANYRIHYNTEDGFLKIGFNNEIEIGDEEKDPALDSKVEEMAAQLLNSLGGDENSVDGFHVRSLVVSTKEEAGSEQEKEMSRKVFMNREYRGIPVGGEKLVVTASLDGAFQKAIGKWSIIQQAESVLSTTKTVQDIKDIALERICNEQLIDEKLGDVKIGTYLKAESVATGRIFALKGYYKMQRKGPGGVPGAWEGFEFDL